MLGYARVRKVHAAQSFKVACEIGPTGVTVDIRAPGYAIIRLGSDLAVDGWCLAS